MGMLSMGLIVVPITAVIYARMNARRDAAQHEVEENSPSAPYTDEELKRMGDRAPGFRYTL